MLAGFQVPATSFVEVQEGTRLNDVSEGDYSFENFEGQ